MAALSFELTTTPGTISADVNYYEVESGGDYDPVVDPDLANPEHIHDDQDWEIRLENMVQDGAVFGAFGGNTWRFRVYFELYGEGEGPGFLETTFDVETETDEFEYPTQIISVTAGTLPVGNYEMVGELAMVDENGLTPISGAKKIYPLAVPGNMLQIINA
jgi:hypothetical protein